MATAQQETNLVLVLWARGRAAEAEELSLRHQETYVERLGPGDFVSRGQRTLITALRVDQGTASAEEVAAADPRVLGAVGSSILPNNPASAERVPRKCMELQDASLPSATGITSPSATCSARR